MEEGKIYKLYGRLIEPDAAYACPRISCIVAELYEDQTPIAPKTSSKPNSNNESSSSDESESPILIEDVPVSITIRQPDSIGTVYMDATYTNNSTKSLVGYEITVLLKDQNKKVYLTCYDTLLPGDSSPKFDTFAPKTQEMEDVEFLEYDITVLNDDGSKTYIDYNCKLKTYDIL